MVSPEFAFVQRHDALVTEDFAFQIDEYKKATGEQFLLAHIRVDRWSPSVCKRIRAQWGVLRQFVTAPLFACPKVEDQRWHKFVSMLGFKYLQRITCNNGADRPLYVSL